jgi:hypothetical protein
LGQEYYFHDFSKIENIHRERDAEVYGFADMHEVRQKLEKISLKPEEMLSENILSKCKGAEFWRNATVEADIDSEEDNSEIKYLDSFETTKDSTDEQKFIG